LDVEVDFLGIFGAVCIIAGTFSIIAVKKFYSKNIQNPRIRIDFLK